MFDGSNEALGRTDCNGKNLNSLRCTIAEKQENPQKMIILPKNNIFGVFSWFLQQRYIKNWGFFALQSVRPGAKFELSNTPIQ